MIFDTQKDAIVFHLVLSTILEVNMNVPVSYCGDFEPHYSIHNQGPHRLYQFHMEIRDDCSADNFILTFEKLLSCRTAKGKIKPLFVELEQYPGFVKNFTSAYLTVSLD